MVCPQRLQKQPAFYRLLIVVCLTIGLLVATPWVSAKESQKLKPQVWQIHGIEAALEDSSLIVQNNAADKLTEYHLDNPKALFKNYENLINKFVQQANATSSDERRYAAWVLGAMKAKEQVPVVVRLLNDSAAEVRANAARALGAMEAKEQAFALIEPI